jgi:hypothetical protein
MITQNIVKSFVAASTIAEFDVVKFDTNGKIAQCAHSDAGSTTILGIAQRGCAAGETTDVLVYGVSRAKLAAIADFSGAGAAALTVSDTGKLETAGAGDFVVARILPNINSTLSANNDQGEVLFVGPSIVKA